MISGFNTDILHDGVVYHVQTEDKGRANPVIESLIYVGGQVVVTKRDGYGDLLDPDQGDQAIAERMDRQHRVLMAAIKSGRFDDQFKALLDSGEVLVTGDSATAEEQIGAVVDAIQGVDSPSVTDSAIERVKTRAFDRDQPLDEVVLEYLKAEKAREHLVLVSEEGAPAEHGETAGLTLRAHSSETGAPVKGAQVMVKMISTFSEPAVLVEGLTDEKGELVLSFEIPEPGAGSAALIISASSDIGSAELKQLL
jgi:hypothetical protein